MGGGMGGPAPKRQLSTLVRKLELLTGDIEIELTAEQAARIDQLLAELSSAETMTDDEAKQKHDELLALLTEEQKEKEQAVGLPMGGGGGGGGRGGMGMGMMRGGPGGGGPGGGQPDDANPFTSDENKKALEALRARVGGASTDEQPAAAADEEAEQSSPPADTQQ